MISGHRVLARSLAVALTLGVAVGLAGCGNQHKGPGYADGGSTLSYTTAELSKDDIMQATYAAAMKAKTVHIAMRMSGKVALRASGDMKYGGKQPAMQMTMSMPQLRTGKIAMRLVGGVMYMRIPQMTPPGKFLAIDPRDQSSPLAKSFAGTTNQMDPLKSVRSLESAVTSADRVGKQTMGGTEVEHYKLTVDSAALTKQLGSPPGSASLPEHLDYDLWLDARHLLRRMSFELQGMRFESDLSRWGEPVRIQKPSPSQIAQLPGA
jgi:hypothetical protein